MVRQDIQSWLTVIAVTADSCSGGWMGGDKRIAGRLTILAALLLQHAAS